MKKSRRDNLPIIAIIGKPNVGKSTLFNRVIRKRRAIVDRIAGTTRDRIYERAEWQGWEFLLVDTGGFWTGKDFDDPLLGKVREGVLSSLEESDIIIFLLDGKDGVSAIDIELSKILRGSGKNIIPCINKIDSRKREEGVFEFFSLGYEDFILISASHGKGIDLLLDRAKKLSAGIYSGIEGVEEKVEEIKLSLLGRPNVGKSSILNRLVQREVSLVHEKPGTTRDTIDTTIDTKWGRFRLIDTAGIRRKGRVEKGVESWSVLRAIKNLRRSDVSAVVLDGEEGITNQDIAIANLIQESGAGLILILNKWDIARERGDAPLSWVEGVRNRMREFSHAPLLFVSAIENFGIEEILPTAKRVFEERRRRIKTPELNRFIETLNIEYPLGYRGRKSGRILYGIQKEGVAPPFFIFFTNLKEPPSERYHRFVQRRIRECFGFSGVPIRIGFRERRNR